MPSQPTLHLEYQVNPKRMSKRITLKHYSIVAEELLMHHRYSYFSEPGRHALHDIVDDRFSPQISLLNASIPEMICTSMSNLPPYTTWHGTAAGAIARERKSE